MSEPNAVADTAEKDALRMWPFVTYRGTCIVGHEPFRTRFRARMWLHDRRCTRVIPPEETPRS